jgi:hypothetical protein
MSHRYIQYKDIKTGDILLFSSWTLQALILRVGLWNEYSHSGIAVWLQTDEGTRLHVFEMSVINDSFCALKRGFASGCRLVDINQIVGNCSKICVRRLNIERDDDFYTKLNDLMMEYKDTQFENNYLRLALYNSGVIQRPASDTSNSIVCSQLCAIWLDKLGLIPKDIIADYPNYRATPPDFFNCNIYPETMFKGPPIIVYDSEIDTAVITAIVVIQLCSLFLYILLTVDDEKSYRGGYRRRPEMKKKINNFISKFKRK